MHHEYAILPGSRAVAAGPEKVPNLPDCPTGLPGESFGNFLEFTHSTFKGEKVLEDKASRSLWNPVVNVGDEKQDINEQDAVRRHSALMRELIMEYLESDGEWMWAARSRVATDVWLEWIADVLNLDDSGKSPCSFPDTGRRMLLTGRAVQAEME